MASGMTHLLIGLALTASFMVGNSLVDFDHYKLFGGKHSINDLKKGFTGEQYKDTIRNDESHFMHKPSTYNKIFLLIGCMVMFGIGYLIHLRLDRIL